jgi:signal transduction histidine kinase
MNRSPNLLARQLRISALEAEAARFRRFARDAPIGIAFIGNDGTLQFANDEYLRIVGRAREEFEAERFDPARGAPPEWLRPERGLRHESECIRPDGERVPILVGLARQPDGVAAFVIDLTAEKAARRALHESEERARALAERLTEVDRRKDHFMATLSHELRNPLAPIRTALQILERVPPGGEQAVAAQRIISRQALQLTRLVDDLLDVTRVARGKIDLVPRRVDLAEIVRRAVEDYGPEFASRGIALALEGGEAVWIDADPTRVAQVVGNLLQNALRYTCGGGHVVVSVGEEEGRAVLRVKDDGMGISPEALPHLFEPFVQAEYQQGRQGGLGLGLALVKGFVELHGGSVSVRSNGLDQGSEFTVELPLSAGLQGTETSGGGGQGECECRPFGPCSK